jgi:hypothetical protein
LWFRFGKNARVEGYPPPPSPLKALLGAEFAKMLCKILSPKGLGVTILITKNLLVAGERLSRPLAPWKSSASLPVEGKVRCHRIVLWKFPGT